MSHDLIKMLKKALSKINLGGLNIDRGLGIPNFLNLSFKKRMRLLFVSLIAIFLFEENPCVAQLALKSQEVWPSLDTYLRLNKKWRLYGTVAGTKMEESSYSEGAAGIFADYFAKPLGFVQKRVHSRNDSLPGKYLYFRFGYQYSATPPSSEDPFKESMLVMEANARFYLPYNFLLSAKNRFDWRSKNGDVNIRYRPRLMLERDLKTEFLTFTASGFVEYFANFGNGQVDKLRTQLGVEIRVTKHMNYEVFWNHQFENQPEVQEVDAFGMTMKLYFHKNDFNKPLFGKKRTPAGSSKS